MSTIESKKDAAYVVNKTDLIPLSNLAGTVPKAVNIHQIENAITRSIVDMAPTAAIPICSPITGDPDLNLESNISGFYPLLTGFITPHPGIITEVGFYTQGNGGTGVSRNIRWGVGTVASNPAAATGIEVPNFIAQGVTSLADNAADGKVVLVTGANIPVDEYFAVCLKGARQTVEGRIFAQNCLSAGAMPGVIGDVSGPLVSAATYYLESFDTDAVNPAVFVPATVIAAPYKGISMYVLWKGV